MDKVLLLFLLLLIIHTGMFVPFDLRMRRILLPGIESVFLSNCGCPFSFQHTSDNLDLRNTVGVTENDTDLRWGGTLLCELADLVDNLLWGGLQPRWRLARVWNSRGRNALATAVHATHVGCVCVCRGSCLAGEVELVVVGRWSSKSKFASDLRFGSAPERNSGRGVRHVLPRLGISMSWLDFSITNAARIFHRIKLYFTWTTYCFRIATGGEIACDRISTYR